MNTVPTTPKVAPYGSWKSPITADLIASSSIRLGMIVLDGPDTYWIEGRPSEGGRSVIVRRTPDGQTVDMTPPPFNVRSRVHEYGGGDYTVSNGVIYFSNFADQRVYRLIPGEQPQPITPPAQYRYAEASLDRQRHRLLCVREDHTGAGREPVNTLVSLSIENNSDGGQILVSGNDFYASAVSRPDGSRLAWLTWNHPNMPWDGTELWVGEFNEDGSLGKAECIAGGNDESIFQPEWSPDGVLHFVSDRTGWWNLYRFRNGQIEPLCEKAAEFGLPQWAFGMSTYECIDSSRIICWYTENGIGHLASLNTATGDLHPFDLPYTTIGNIQATAQRVVFYGASPTQPGSIVELDLRTGKLDVLRRSSKVTVDASYFSLPESIEFPTEHGRATARVAPTAFAFFYPLRNPDYVAPSGELPPLLVMSHGGPTAAASSAFDLQTQFWTSRGIAVLDVNYGGSTGYGRAYRERLNGQWGIVDVDDCVNGAKYLVEQGRVDGNRLAITGGSAGGYTTLCALTFRDVFKAGASHYGISDLDMLAEEDHKFESHYSHRLIGPYPERRDLYIQRSPIYFTERLSCPVIFFQGLEDRVVLPNQAEKMVEALREKKIPVAYIAFEGEGHGFRRAENIKRALEAELYFYSRVFGFQVADEIAPVEIENM